MTSTRYSLKITSSPTLRCLSAAHNPPSTRAHSCRYTPPLKYLHPGYLQKNNVAKGDDGYGTEGRGRGEREREEGWRKVGVGESVERRLRGAAENVQARADAGRFVSWNGVAPFSAVAKKSSRTSCISFFPLPLLAVTSRTRETRTGCLKTDRY